MSYMYFTIGVAVWDIVCIRSTSIVSLHGSCCHGMRGLVSIACICMPYISQVAFDAPPRHPGCHAAVFMKHMANHRFLTYFRTLPARTFEYITTPIMHRLDSIFKTLTQGALRFIRPRLALMACRSLLYVSQCAASPKHIPKGRLFTKHFEFRPAAFRNIGAWRSVKQSA